MNEVRLHINEEGKGIFYIDEDGETIAKMVIRLAPGRLTAIHTEVDRKAEGRGLAKKLLTAMANYARERSLKVRPDCPYVHAQFERHPDEYADIWERDVV